MTHRLQQNINFKNPVWTNLDTASDYEGLRSLVARAREINEGADAEARIVENDELRDDDDLVICLRCLFVDCECDAANCNEDIYPRNNG